MAECRFENKLPIQQIDGNPPTGVSANLSLLPNHPPGGPFQTMQQCQGTLCESVGECIPHGFQRVAQKVSLPASASKKGIDDCLNDCRMHKECVAAVYDEASQSCATMNEGNPKLKANESSTGTLYVRKPIR